MVKRRSDLATADLHIRLLPRELRAWKAAARREGVTLTVWLRALANPRALAPSSTTSPVVSGDLVSGDLVSGDQIELPLDS